MMQARLRQPDSSGAGADAIVSHRPTVSKPKPSVSPHPDPLQPSLPRGGAGANLTLLSIFSVKPRPARFPAPCGGSKTTAPNREAVPCRPIIR